MDSDYGYDSNGYGWEILPYWLYFVREFLTNNCECFNLI